MKDIGTQDEPLRFIGEELQLDVYDGNDPADTGARRWWYRTDLSVNESDAVLRVNNNGEIVDVPVYEESTPVESGINTSFGVVAPGLAEPAFVPLTDPADAAFDFVAVETPSGTELSLHNRTAPSSAIPDSVVTRPADDGSFGSSIEYGFVISVSSDWPSIGATISSNSSGFTRAYLAESDNTIIDEVDISGLSAGDSFIFDDVNLTSGQNYLIYIDAEGASWTVGNNADEANYPYTANDVSITQRWAAGGTDTQGVAAIDSIGNVGF